MLASASDCIFSFLIYKPHCVSLAQSGFFIRVKPGNIRKKIS
ncbi:hypothetical protein HMPREF3212_03154 [Citrobacter freundii]|nr:hypothetical protein AB07_0870 [Citrobacter freundii]KWZ89284.1 hypothetical protein HMPREF3212_03154 [Citrobacter freundii]